MAVEVGYRNRNFDRIQMDPGNGADQIDGAFIKGVAERVWGRIIEWIVRGYESITAIFFRVIEFYRHQPPKNDRLSELCEESSRLLMQIENQNLQQELANFHQQVESRAIRLQELSDDLVTVEGRFSVLQERNEDMALRLARIEQL